ncbi:MAG: hypothetical protein ACK5LL_15035 [Suipraeoptans sp.]
MDGLNIKGHFLIIDDDNNTKEAKKEKVKETNSVHARGSVFRHFSTIDDLIQYVEKTFPV